MTLEKEQTAQPFNTARHHKANSHTSTTHQESYLHIYCFSEKLMNLESTFILGFAGHRARDPPDPIPNSEVKPRSVPSISVVFGHVSLGKLAASSDC